MKGFKRKFRKKHSLDGGSELTLQKFTPKAGLDDNVSNPVIQTKLSPETMTKSKSSPKIDAAKSKSSSKKKIFSLTPTFYRKNKSASSSPAFSNKLSINENGAASETGSRMTSFSSSRRLSSSYSNISSSVKISSSTNLLSSLPENYRSASLNFSSPDTSPSSVFSSSATSNNMHSALKEVEKKRKKRFSVKSMEGSISADPHHTNLWKKFPVHLRKKEPLKEQNSKDEVKKSMRHAASLSDLICDDPGKTTEMIEKFREENEALELEVRGKDEEVRMLNATIDQVNMTWEQKVQAMMRDLEDANKKNEYLRARLSKESYTSPSNNNKSTVRVPLNHKPKSIQETTNQSNRSSTDDESASVSNGLTSPRVNRRGIREPTRKMGVAVRSGTKSDDVKLKLLQSLMTSRCLSQLSSGDLVSIADVMKSKRINIGERLMKEGGSGQAFYILAEGECRIFKENQESISPNLSQSGRIVKQWELIGEADLFYNTRRVWSCKCTRVGLVWYITRDEFKSAIMQQDIIHSQKKEIFHFIKNVKILLQLEDQNIKEVANVSKIVQFAKGDYIIRQSSSASSVYILKEGEVTLTKIIDGSETRMETLSPGQLVGAITSSSRHQYNAVASGKEVVQCVAIPIQHFDKIRDRVTIRESNVTITKVNASLSKRNLLGDGQDSLSSGKTGSSSGYGSELNSPNIRRRQNSRYENVHSITFAEISNRLKGKSSDDFETVTMIGKGAFGSVTLAKLKNDEKNVFAVKKLSKHDVVVAEHQQNVYSEKTIQMESSRDCPFIVSLYSTFKDNRFVYFVMEFCPGGELFSLLSQAKSFDDDTARFYASCVLEALIYLHSKNVVFRDLKPENVVLDKEGYCKLTDFGFAKKVTKKSSSRTYTYCGTPEYMAPETILYHAQSFQVDIWTLGVFIFEMLDGKAPFRNKNRAKLADSILAGIEPMLEISRVANRIVNTSASSVIKELCRARPEDRLGSGKGGITLISKHAWFQKTNWKALRQRQVPAPWKPKLIDMKDTSYFKPATKFKKTSQPKEEFSGWDENF